jgi:hypothetical protein
MAMHRTENKIKVESISTTKHTSHEHTTQSTGPSKYKKY